MDISGIGQANGIDYISALTNRRNRSYADQTRSSASNADTVSISGEAMEKYLAMKKAAGKQENSSDVSSQVAAWYDNFRENMGMVEEPDYSTWPPENVERRQQLLEERDALIPHASNTTFTEANKKLNGVLDKLMALDAVGGKQALSDNGMEAAVNSLQTAMDGWGNRIPGTAAYLAGMGEAPSGAVLTPDGGIMYPTSGTASSLSQIYFMNRFPEKEEEDLLLEEEKYSENENSSNAAASVNDGQTTDERETRKVAMYKLADYITDAPRNTAIIERADVPAATKVWIDVPLEI